MNILLINPPHPAIGSRIPDEHLPPLGLLSLGGPLIDAGHAVRLLDAEFGPMETESIVAASTEVAPDIIMLGHSGSTSGHPVVVELTRALKRALPDIVIVYGGVYPTFSWRSILKEEPQIDVIVRGEGEATIVRLINALESGFPLQSIPGVAFREGDKACATAEAPLIEDLDAHRVGWELIDHARYSYWGHRRAVVMQFSRGCPHACSYCGQRLFWKRWRHRDPRAFAAEIAQLHRLHGVEVINFADENPTACRSAWRAFLEALIEENVAVTLVGSTRAADIVRDADILHLYRQAGVARFLLGIESYSPDTLRKIRKGSTEATDRRAIQLLRQHGMLSMATYVVGFDEERDMDYLRSLRYLLSYDPDQVQLLYAVPHHWTAYAAGESHRRVVQPDLRHWDYKHQVLATRHLPAWRVLLWVKFIEAVMQGRPRALRRLWCHPDRSLRAAMQWYYGIGRKVWPYEIRHFFLHERRLKRGPTLGEFEGGGASRSEDLAVASPQACRTHYTA